MKTAADVDVFGATWKQLDTALMELSVETGYLEAVAVCAENKRKRDELKKAIDELREAHEPAVIKFAKTQLKGARAWASSLIEVSFRRVSATKIDVIGEVGVAFVVKHCPEAVKYEPKIVKAQLTKAFVDKVSAMSKTALARAGISVVKPHDSITVSLRAD